MAKPDPNPTTKLRLGDLLLQAGAIAEEQLVKALAIQKRSGARLGEVLVQEGFISPHRLTEVLESQLGIRRIDLRVAPLDTQAARRIPENLARRHLVLPVQVVEGRLLLAMKDPLDRIALQDVQLITGMPVTPLVAAEPEILAAIERVFGQQRAASRVADDLAVRAAVPAAAAEAAAAMEVESAPVVQLVNSIIENAVRSRASDIHLEPRENRLRIRTRVDGVLQEVLNTDIQVHGALVGRIKVLADMNIAEKRLPQDGKILTRVDGRLIDLRISTMPTTYDEKVAIRILDRASFLVGKQHLGFSAVDSDKFDRLVARPHGIILATGPTGSGKTTTLYAILSQLDAVRNNIMTLEDPVEYDMDDISQTQINVQAGLTFASGLRTLMRQDPDVIMVGEIRDRETAEIAVRAALTGHLVLSTLHTNDAPGAIARLIDIGIEPYLIASALAGVVAQRLVRRVCSDCREAYPADAHARAVLGLPDGEPVQKLVRRRGCAGCNQTGYRGRTGTFEILDVDAELRALIGDRLPTDELREAALRRGMVPLWQDCREKLLAGITTLEEVLRVTQIN